jgi:diacylglycerol kinase (ATP)
MIFFNKIFKAFSYSIKGLRTAFKHEFAFVVEIFLSIVLIPLAFVLGNNIAEYALLIGSWLLILIIELVNSAIETVIDRISLEKNNLSARAKDLGAAATFIAWLNFIILWGLMILKLFRIIKH